MPKRISKQYNANGLSGCVIQQKNRLTKFMVGVYHGEQAGMESDSNFPWVTVCEKHGSIVASASITNAKTAMTFPDWCEDCQKLMYKDD